MSSVLEITDPKFEEEVFHAKQPVLVYFWASWCGPCKLVSPSISAIAKTYSNRLKVVKLEVDPNPKATAECQVEGVPALRLYKDKELLASHEGAITKQKLIEEILDPYLS
ncbi:thioredoxin [cyanobacterium endosymbiont of Rhopalodia gibberula]|uniref:thioredoxin family protein n=1 Tax=cyanobacterium endosymbiont of Rhopalodia gibberula TaxID=1763363 RepID=UPI000DC7102B|nr:thioredoxin family protein [cyanobacterium endosymbiont of Rhopalodia gibberula]BBA80301.1 thioredoxin [cyanobacterium endosymbiont of Rhopalodia gibberula]